MKNILIVVCVLVVIGGIYYFALSGGKPSVQTPPGNELVTGGRSEEITVEKKGNLGIATTKGGEKYVVDRDGFTLYYNIADEGQKSANLSWSCDRQCELRWKPYLVDEQSTPLERSSDPLLRNLNTYERPDGREQYALRTKLLYRYSKDLIPGDAKGDMGNGWMLVRP